MNDHELDTILNELAGEKIAAPDVLISETKSALRCRRLLPLSVVASFGFLTICTLAGIYTFIYLDIPLQAKAYGITAIFATFGAIDLALVASRGRIAAFCRKMERTICHR